MFRINPKKAFMSKVAKDIIHAEFKPNMTLRQFQKQFFKIMQKHGIASGTIDKKGRLSCSNFEWTMAVELYLQTFINSTKLDMFFFDEKKMPENLQYYRN